MDLMLLTPVLPERLLQMKLLFSCSFCFVFFLQSKRCTHVFEHMQKCAPVVNILVTCQRQGKIFSRLAQNKHKFEQKGFGEKDKRCHTISSQRETVINIPVVDIIVNKIFINFAPNGK